MELVIAVEAAVENDVGRTEALLADQGGDSWVGRESAIYIC